MAEQTEVAIIGAGVVGLAIAERLSRTVQVVLLERHESYGRETSSHNSGVVHAGVYYPSDWLKTRLCIEGNALLYQWASTNGVRAERIGKLIIASDASELPTLERLFAEAHANGVPDLRMLDRAEVQRLEPSVRAIAAIYSGSSGVIDQMQLMQSLLHAAEANDAPVAFKHTVSAIRRIDAGFELTVIDPAGQTFSLRTPVLINSTGLAADGIAALLGYPLDGADSVPRLRQSINKGRYYDIVNPARAKQLTHLIYPLPHASRAGLGVHVTLDIDGGVHLGPDTEWLASDALLDYRADDSRREQFVAAAQSYLPWLAAEDVMPGHVGYRPKLHDAGGGPADFLIWHDRGYVHLGGIESPGMTASLAIARHITQMLAG